MRPICFEGCFGWLHAADSRVVACARGVVLCAPLGHEGLWAHKMYRQLAERLAARGIPVLRFDYPGSGDSLGEELADGRVAASIESVRAAIHALRAHTGATWVTVAGMRAGAAFGALALDERTAMPLQVDSVAWIAPVAQGRAYLRELKVLQQNWRENSPPAVRAAQREDGTFTVLGHRFSAEFIEQMSQIDMVAAIAAAPDIPQRVLIVDRAIGAGTALRDAYLARGADVAVAPFDDYTTAMVDSAFSRIPGAVVDAVTQWVSALPAGPAARRYDASVRCAGARVGRVSADVADAEADSLMLETPGAIEKIVWVGAKRLFGILCMPAYGSPGLASPAAPPVLLIANTAANAHFGDARLAVRLARRLAQAGIASLRFDVEGVGDSGARAPDDQSRILYSDGAIEDVADAAQWLAARGYAQIVAFGICSGGYTALHAAARSPAVSGVISINLQRFVWPEGLTIQEAIKRQANSTRAYAASMLEWRKWRQVLRGDKSFVAIAGTLLSHGVARLRRPLARALEQLGAPTQSPERALAATLERCGTRTLLVYGSYDPGVDELVRHFGQGGRMLSASKHTRIVFDDALDHALFGQDAGDNVIQLCKTFFSDGLHRAHDDAKRISIAASWKTS